MVEQRKGPVLVAQDPVGGHDMGGQLAPGPEPRRSQAVLVEARQAEQVRGGPYVAREQFLPGYRNLFDEDLHSVDFQGRRRAAHPRPDPWRLFHHALQSQVTQQRKVRGRGRD